MRITYNYMTMRYLNGIQHNLNTVSNDLDSVLKGRDLIKPEQDPVNYISALSLQTTLNDAAQFKRNAQNALSWFENADNELQQASDLLSRALNEYAIYGMNDSQNATSRKALANDVLSIIDGLLERGNAYYNGRYIFSGYDTQTQPFQNKERQVSSVNSNISGAEVMLQKQHNDMPELVEGSYTAKATVVNGVVSVQLFDKNGKNILIDTNGTDESAGNGNLASYTLTTAYSKGMVINTGTGIGIKLPDTDMEGRTLVSSMYYKPGGNVGYYGDDGVVTTKIGYTQDVALNTTGREIFMSTFKTLRGTVTNTVNGLFATSTTYFSNLDGANANKADSIKITGTDHNGFKVGIAKLSAPAAVTLDMTQATKSERTVTLRYADEDFEITLDQKGYSNTDEVIFELNRKLENAGLGSEIKAVNDGDRVMFVSTRSGDHVQIELKGTVNNKLGFNDPTPTTDLDFTYYAAGKNTVFEVGYDNYTKPVVIKYTNETATGGNDNRAQFPVGINEIFVDGVSMRFTVNAGDTAADIQNTINSTLKSNGFAFSVTAEVQETGSADLYNLTLKLQNANYDSSTFLSAKVNTVDGINDYKTDTPRNDDYPMANEKRLGDMLTFIENLYDNAASATLVDGKLIIQDVRSGSSRLTFGINESNTGIGYPMLEHSVDLTGKYNGTKDDKWSFNLIVQPKNPADPSDYDKIIINVTDAAGNKVASQTVKQDAYHGQEIEIARGVKITLGQVTNSTSFSLDLKAASNVSFGDINVIEDGKNVDTFRSLDNLYNALNLDITKQGVGAPSAWRDPNLNSTATPYFEGTFRGNYNDMFNFLMMGTNNVNEMYIQSELKTNLDSMKYALNTDIDFDLVVKNGSNINTKNIVVNQNDVFSGLASPTKGTEPARLAFTEAAGLSIYYQHDSVWTSVDITIPAGTYASLNDLVSTINSNGAMPAGITAHANSDGTIGFSSSGPVSDLNVSGFGVDSPLGFEAFSPEQLLADKINYIISADPDLASLGVRSYFNNGVLELFSGSGTNEISLSANNAGTAMTFYGSATVASLAAPLSFTGNKVLDLSYYNTTTSSWHTAQVNFPADPSGTYANPADLAAAAIGLPAGITLTADSSGKLGFSAAAPLTNLNVSGNLALSSKDPNELGSVLGFFGQVTPNSVASESITQLSLAHTDTGTRTITFNYNDGLAKHASITISAKDYDSISELLDDVNTQLSAQGLSGLITAQLVDGDKLSFVYDDTTLNSFHVSGDYEGTLGFTKAGTETQIKVTGSDGEMIASYIVDTANKLYHVADGVYSGFDAGFMHATDSFTTAVGSGIDYEIPILDQASTQAVTALTTTGTRQNKVDSVINYYAVMSTTNEGIKAGYLGATTAEQSAAYSRYQLSVQAYQAALQTTAKIMNLSLLNFLS